MTMNTKTVVAVVIMLVLVTMLSVYLYVVFFDMYSEMGETDVQYCGALLRQGGSTSSEYVNTCVKN